MGGRHLRQGEWIAIHEGAKLPGFHQGGDLCHDLAMPRPARAQRLTAIVQRLWRIAAAVVAGSGPSFISSFLHFCIMVLLYYCIVLLNYCIIVLLHYCIIVFMYCIFALLYRRCKQMSRTAENKSVQNEVLYSGKYSHI